MWPYARPVPGRLRQWAGSPSATPPGSGSGGGSGGGPGSGSGSGSGLGSGRGRGRGSGGRLRRHGLRLWFGFRRGRWPRPGFRRLRPWSGWRPRRRLRVRRLRHWQPLRLPDWRRLHRFGARRFRPCRLRLAGIVGYFARVHCGSDLLPPWDNSRPRGSYPRSGRIRAGGVHAGKHVELTVSGGCCTSKR